MLIKDLVRRIWKETDAELISKKYIFVKENLIRRYLMDKLTTEDYFKALLVADALYTLAYADELQIDEPPNYKGEPE